jgi:cobalt/nickel transport system permease protein
MLFHVGGFHSHIDDGNVSAPSSGLWNGLTIQTKLICTFLSVCAITLTPNGRWLTWLFYGLGLIGLMAISQVSLSKLIKRIAIESAFLSVVLLGTLFRGGGEVLWAWGGLQITTEGLLILGSVSSKALLSLFVLNILTLTTSIQTLLNGLVVLRTPPLLVAILGSMYRYIYVLIDQFHSMDRAAASRNFSKQNLWNSLWNIRGNGRNRGLQRAWQREVLGNMIGMLFIRSYDRGDRIHQAMLSRGYQGVLLVVETPQIGQRDFVALNLTLVVVLIGQAFYLQPK